MTEPEVNLVNNSVSCFNLDLPESISQRSCKVGLTFHSLYYAGRGHLWDSFGSLFRFCCFAFIQTLSQRNRSFGIVDIFKSSFELRVPIVTEFTNSIPQIVVPLKDVHFVERLAFLLLS